MRSWLRWSAVVVGICTAALLAQVGAAARPSVSAFVVFGTSLSDSGNAFALQGTTSRPPYDTLDGFLVPGSPYARGGHHFSNGPTWIEQLAGPLGLDRSVAPAFNSESPFGSNYAVGAARAWQNGTTFNLGAQVTAYLADTGGSASPDALHVIEIGGNDVRDALVVYAMGGDGSVVLGQALAATQAAVTNLYAAGARRFLIWNVPNVGLTPAVRSLDAIFPGASASAAALAMGYNANLQGLLTGLGAALPGVDIDLFDAFQTLTDITGSPGFYGLSNVADACVTPGLPPYDCQIPDEYLFWDGVHPTKVVHAILAERVAAVVFQP